MLADQVAFETALQDAIDLMEHPPRPGTEEDARLQGLLNDISRYQPQEAAAATAGEPAARDRFNERLEAFEARRAHEAEESGYNPDGIGPTLGMDVGAA
jgi:hypothetical protein